VLVIKMFIIIPFLVELSSLQSHEKHPKDWVSLLSPFPSLSAWFRMGINALEVLLDISSNHRDDTKIRHRPPCSECLYVPSAVL
jgi:hypothetical protein